LRWARLGSNQRPLAYERRVGCRGALRLVANPLQIEHFALRHVEGLLRSAAACRFQSASIPALERARPGGPAGRSPPSSCSFLLDAVVCADAYRRPLRTNSEGLGSKLRATASATFQSRRSADASDRGCGSRQDRRGTRGWPRAGSPAGRWQKKRTPSPSGAGRRARRRCVAARALMRQLTAAVQVAPAPGRSAPLDRDPRPLPARSRRSGTVLGLLGQRRAVAVARRQRRRPIRAGG
jgi:hypothetical protein